MKNLTIDVVRNHRSVTVCVYEEVGPNQYRDLAIQNGVVCPSDIKSGNEMPEAPFLRMDASLFEELLKAFTDFAHKNGIPTTSQAYQDGKIEVLEKHLDRMSGWIDAVIAKS